MGPAVPEREGLYPGCIVYFSPNWQEQFAIDEMGDDTRAALPYTALWGMVLPSLVGKAQEAGAHFSEETVKLSAEIAEAYLANA